MRCLKKKYKKNELKPRCKDAMRLSLLISAHDLKADPFYRDCAIDIGVYIESDSGDTSSCSAKDAQEARECLRKHLELLEPDCKKAQFTQAQIEEKDVDLKPKLKRLCALDIDRYCGSVDDVVGCLQDHDQQLKDPRCQRAVQKDAELTSQDYRLKYGISTNCAHEISSLCGSAAAAAEGNEGDAALGSVLNCLVKQRAQAGSECKMELGRLMRLQSNNWRINAKLKT